MTQKWVRVLSAATGQAGLEASTLITLSRHVSGDLVASANRVFLQCVAEDLACGLLPYGRRLWRLKSMTCCPVQRSHLVEPSCGRGEAPVRAHFGRVKLAGVCNQCGSIGYRCFASTSTEACVGEVWRAKQCQRMIGALPLIAAVDPRARADKSGAAVGRTLSVLSRWMNNPHARLSFDQLLDLYGVEGWDLAALLQGRLEASQDGAGPVEPSRIRRRRDGGVAPGAAEPPDHAPERTRYRHGVLPQRTTGGHPLHDLDRTRRPDCCLPFARIPDERAAP